MANEDEGCAAREYWASLGREPFYESAQHWRSFMARRVAEYEPATVLEFGCNVGRNLVEVRKVAPRARVVGYDVNRDAVAAGAEKYGLDLREGGEERISELRMNSIDVIFTMSVLDHIPNVQPVVNELTRVASVAVLFLEPVIAVEGRADESGSQGSESESLTSVPFTYSWNYARLVEGLGEEWRWSWLPYPLAAENMGPHYWLIEGTSRGIKTA